MKKSSEIEFSQQAIGITRSCLKTLEDTIGTISQHNMEEITALYADICRVKSKLEILGATPAGRHII